MCPVSARVCLCVCTLHRVHPTPTRTLPLCLVVGDRLEERARVIQLSHSLLLYKGQTDSLWRPTFLNTILVLDVRGDRRHETIHSLSMSPLRSKFNTASPLICLSGRNN